jgi:nitrate reductase (cytochrome), electron transfer subunit
MSMSRLMFAVVSMFVGVVAFAGEDPPAEGSIPDSELGLIKVGVFETFSPPAIPENQSAPGEAPLPVRANEESPPVIPHEIVDFLPITANSNLCLECHAVEEKEEGEPTPIPASHYVDLRNAPDEQGEEVAGARYLCISCHVTRTSAALLVGNSAVEADEK